METNDLGSGMFSGIISSGLLGLEIPLHTQHHQNQKSPSSNNPQNQNPSMNHSQKLAYGNQEADKHHPQSQQQSRKHGYPFIATKSKHTPASDEDESGLGADDNVGDKRKFSPWHRMKWTDAMVRLLIMAVFYIGDEGASEATDKKKLSGGLLQKKGKWKSVSRAMMEKGFYVSPQQSEDKFNDLNKRFKRVNDILGKGTACRVVENQSLLDTIDLTPKMKEEVRKLLNSKHLFFKEMCAYHNSCGHGTGGGDEVTGAQHSPEPSQNQPQQHHCFHSSDDNNTPALANLGRQENDQGSKVVKAGSGREDEGGGEDDDDDDDSDCNDDEEEEVNEGGSREEYENGEMASRKRPINKGGLFGSTPLIQQLSSEVMVILQDGSKSDWEKKQWMKMRLLRLEEQQISYQCEAFEIEKQRLKWIKFSSKKEREMERNKLENERRRLENERMVFLIRHKEFEL